MEPPALEFVEEPYDDDTLNALITGFQKTGCAVLPNVFERQSVDPFLEQLQAAGDLDAADNTQRAGVLGRPVCPAWRRKPIGGPLTASSAVTVL